MKLEKMILVTGKQYQDIKTKVDNGQSFTYNIGTDEEPQNVTVTGAYLDTDPEFTHNPGEYGKVEDDTQVQVMIEFEGNSDQQNTSTIKT